MTRECLRQPDEAETLQDDKGAQRKEARCRRQLCVAGPARPCSDSQGIVPEDGLTNRGSGSLLEGRCPVPCTTPVGGVHVSSSSSRGLVSDMG